MAKSKLSNEQQTYVVQALACFDSPSVVVAAIKKDYGVTLTPQAVEGYDPNKKAGAKLADRWRALFAETRKAFLEDTSQIAISHRAVRLRSLQRMAEKAETSGNIVLAASLMEQAAKEVGDAFTNRRELTGKGGGAIRVAAAELSDEDLAAIATGRSQLGMDVRRRCLCHVVTARKVGAVVPHDLEHVIERRQPRSFDGLHPGCAGLVRDALGAPTCLFAYRHLVTV